MAEISKLSRLLAGVERQVDLSTNTLVVGDIKVGGVAGTILTKTILDNLVTLQGGGDAGALHHHDGRYYTKTELNKSTASAATTLIGDDNSYTNFTPLNATLKGTLSGIDEALASAAGTSFSDNDFRIFDNGDNTKILRFEVSTIATATTRTIFMADADVDLALVNSAVQQAQIGVPNGIVPLDGGGKVPVAFLPSAVMTLEGEWDASTNTPTLADGTGDAGMVYEVTTAGTQDLGSGDIEFAVGDWVVYGADGLWYKSVNSNLVTSVNGLVGTVNLTTTNIPEGTALYFTDSRARSATITQVIAGGDTLHAPSSDSVFTALAGKQDADPALDEAIIFFDNTDFTAVEAEVLTSGVLADSLHHHARLQDPKTAGESITSGLKAVRLGKAADAGFVAGRVYLADNNAASADNFYVIGLVNEAVSAGSIIQLTKVGSIVATGHGFTVGEPIFLGASGALTNTAPSADNSAVVRVGFAIDTNTIEVQIQVMGVN